MVYRAPTETDFAGMQALDLELARLSHPHFDTLPETERQAMLRSSLAALRFYARSEHSFVAIEAGGDEEPSTVYGFVHAQSVWMGDKAVVLVSCLRVHPDAPLGCTPGLLHCVTKSAYDGAVYELMFAADSHFEAIAMREGYKDTKLKHMVRILGSRATNQ
ncbi:MAG: DUF1999 family protein [Deinococcales bacterium]